MYLYFPPIPKHSPYKRCSVTVLLDEVDEPAVERILEESGLKEMARERQLILAFPVPGPEGWEYDSDLSVIEQMQGAMTMEREFEPVQTYFGIPTLESMLASWHLMNDTRYLIGIGEKGAAMALTMAACQPANVAAVPCRRISRKGRFIHRFLSGCAVQMHGRSLILSAPMGPGKCMRPHGHVPRSRCSV